MNDEPETVLVAAGSDAKATVISVGFDDAKEPADDISEITVQVIAWHVLPGIGCWPVLPFDFGDRAGSRVWLHLPDGKFVDRSAVLADDLPQARHRTACLVRFERRNSERRAERRAKRLSLAHP